MSGDTSFPSRPSLPEEKKCPFCAETIKIEATVCRFCNRDLVTNGDDPHAAQRVDNGVFWTMAFLPLIGLFVQQFIAGLNSAKTNDLWWISVILNIIFITIDIDKVKKAGLKTDSLAAAGVLLFPVYMFMRGERTKAGPAAGLVWIAMFVISILWGMGIAAGEALQGARPLGQ